MLTHRRLPIFLAALAVWAAPTAAALAAPGDLDSSFGSPAGRARVDFGGSDSGQALVLQADGKIILAGTSDVGGNQNFALARLGPGGSLDSSFAIAGKALIDFGGNDGAGALVLQADGKIVVAGTTVPAPNVADFALTRLDSNGSLDGTFGQAGRTLVDFGGADLGEAVAVQADGKIVVAGSSFAAGYTFALARFNANGSLDTTFGQAGKAMVDLGGYDFGEAMVLQPDGKIVVAGHSDVNNNTNFTLARLDANGSLDTTFGQAGKAVVDFGSSDDGQGVALQRDGKIVVVGSSRGNLVVARLDPNGSLDDSFAGDGKSAVDFGGDFDDGSSVAVQPDGKLVVSGYSYVGADFGIGRLQPNGLLDTTFGDGGKAVAGFGGNPDASQAVALQPDGKIVAAGYSSVAQSGDFAIARLLGDAGGPAGGGGGPGSGPGSNGSPPRCAGRRATIVGTPAADRLRGTSRRDVIVSLGGRDVIRSLGGDDIVCAGSGNDTVFGGRGNDRLGGGSGNDRLLGESGRDRLLGESGRDRLLGGPGRDRLLGGPGRDAQRQ
jgi:uncharacterized delta-60 repeat protein